MTLNSTPDTMNRNAGIFWAIFNSAGIVGNTVAYIQFGGSHDINPESRRLFVSILLVISAGGAVVQFFTLPMHWAVKIEGNNSDTFWTGITRSAVLLATPQMLQFVFFFAYTGLQFAFIVGVFGPSLGFTLSFDNPKELNSLHGIIFSAGETIAGLIFAFFGSSIRRVGHWPAVAVGIGSTLICYALIFLNVPNDAPFGETESAALLDPSNVGMALVSSFFLGFGDGCLIAQTMSLVGTIYRDKSGQAFAIFKSTSHLALATGFAYAGFINLYWQISILTVVGLISFAIFLRIDLLYQKRIKEEKTLLLLHAFPQAM